MKKFPKFLQTMPTIYGLGPYELFSLVISLYIAMLLNLSSLKSIVACLSLIGVTKIIRKRVDFIGLSAPSIKFLDLTKLKGAKK